MKKLIALLVVAGLLTFTLGCPPAATTKPGGGATGGGASGSTKP